MSTKYDTLVEKSGDAELAVGPSREKPKQWPGCGVGAGQFEHQGFESWTPQEQQEWEEGTLTSKWGIGQVSIRLPIRSPLQFVAILYGYLPFIIPIWWLIWTTSTWAKCGSPRFYPTFGLCIAAGFALVNETVTKKICRKLLPADITSRPPEAVCKHPGMPSGHVMNAYTLMVWTLIEVAWDYQIHLDYLLILLVVMGPVPWARVYNNDHTRRQVQVSMAAAVIMGSVAFGIRFLCFPHHRGLWPWDWEGYHVSPLGLAAREPGAHEGAARTLGWDEAKCGLYRL